jgi:hypothetical protein
MATFIDTVNAGAYYLNGVPFHGGGGGGGAGVPVPLFAVSSNTILNTGATSTIPAPGATGSNVFAICGGSTAPQTSITTDISMWHGFDNTNGALVRSPTQAMRFTVARAGMYMFTFGTGIVGVPTTNYTGQWGLQIEVNGYIIANECRNVVGTNTRYSERASISVDAPLETGDVVEFQITRCNSTNAVTIDPAVITCTLLNHPPA